MLDIKVNEFKNINIIEIIVDAKAAPRMLHETSKGLYFMYKGKRIYAYEYDNGELKFLF